MKKYGNKSFANREDLLRFIKANKDFEIQRRKSIVKYSDAVFMASAGLEKLLWPMKDNKASKAVLFSDDIKNGVASRTLLVNTYLWRDSHWDVHLPGTFTRSIEQRALKIPPIDQHNFDLDHIMGNTLSITEQPFDWKALNVDHPGSTIGLVTETEILQSKSPRRYQDYLDRVIDQHSVGMCYLQVSCAIDDPDSPNEYELYKEWIDQIGNQQDVEEDGFFFGVFEAKLMEYSCVIAGSNELTPVLYPSKGTTNGEAPSSDTLKALEALSNKLEFQQTINNLNLKLHG